MGTGSFSLFTAIFVSIACSSTSSPSAAAGCEMRYDCPTGQSCGTADGLTFSCSPSGAGKAGDSCNANQSLPLQCGDQLACVGKNDVGTCSYWCDSNHPCPAGFGSCSTVRSTHGATVSICL
jgi:hypothetical protein